MNVTAIDWNNVWNHYRETRSQNHSGEISTWDSKTKALLFFKKSTPDRIKKVLNDLPLTKHSRVLDIGSGPGVLSIPISENVAHVTAVEPAKGMAAVLNDRIAEKEITNITLVPKRWEAIDIKGDLETPYDIVFAYHSLGLPNIQDAIRKMIAVSHKWVFIYWFSGISSWEKDMIQLWPALHGERYRSGPKADILYQVLYNMGISPNMETRQISTVKCYPDIDAAIAEKRVRFGISTLEQEIILRKYLTKTLEITNSGLIENKKTISAKIWWNVEDYQ